MFVLFQPFLWLSFFVDLNVILDDLSFWLTHNFYLVSWLSRKTSDYEEQNLIAALRWILFIISWFTDIDYKLKQSAFLPNLIYCSFAIFCLFVIPTFENSCISLGSYRIYLKKSNKYRNPTE